MGGDGARRWGILPANTSSVRRKVRVGDQPVNLADLAHGKRAAANLLRSPQRASDGLRAGRQHRGHYDDDHSRAEE